jgi:hypothetical protein
MERINEYQHKSEILRQIHSNRAHRFRRINNFQSIITVIVASFITFIGFYGIDELHTMVNKHITINKATFEFLFNLFVFILFVNVILHLVFNFSKKQSEADKAIVLLTSIINELTDIIENAKGNPTAIKDNIVEVIRNKYLTITSVIPSNTDKQFLKAKKDLRDKEISRHEISKLNTDIFNEEFITDYTKNLIYKSPLNYFLENLYEVNSDLYLGGGAIRNLVWDELHNYAMITQISDLDIVYFDKLNNKKEHDKRLEKQLHKKVPNIKWSVKNQARMHTWNNEAAYESFEEAISKWPETCTAIAVRKNKEGDLEFVNPFSLSDLFRLIVRPTPHFKNRPERFKERYSTKQWKKTWPKIQIIEP